MATIVEYGLLDMIQRTKMTSGSLHENKHFRPTKICEKDRKGHFFISFRMFPFHGNIIFYELSFKRKCKKAASFRKCVFLRKYEIFVYDSCDDEIFYVVLLRKPAIFHLRLGQLFIDNI